MKLSFLKQKNKKETFSYKKDKISVHKIWMVFVVLSILFITAELFFFSWLFLDTINTLDNVSNPELKTNEAKIRSITKIIENIETSVDKRVQGISTSSQN